MSNRTNLNGRPVYIVDGSRTPFLKVRGQPGVFSASDLAVNTCRELLLRQAFNPNDIDEVITGCVMPSPEEANIARLIALRLDCGFGVPAWTVQRNCASGMQALDCAALNIATGRADLILAGGTEAMSRAPILWSEAMVKWLADWQMARSLPKRLQVISQFRLKQLKPLFALLRGLTDPIVNLSMGQTAEKIAAQYQITREQMDGFAVESHQRLAKAQDMKNFPEITPLYDPFVGCIEADTGLRRDSQLAQLAKLKPVFDKPFGLVTAANSSQVSDGAAFLILASYDAVKKYKLPVMGRIIDVQWASLDPATMGYGPIHAMTPLLERQRLKLSDIDYWEINEAFAAQVLACVAAWQDPNYCQQFLGLSQPMGELNLAKVNVDGGAIALGHPLGASGARVVLHLLHVLNRTQSKRGIASLCIGGGQGGAMLIETLTGDAIHE